MKKLLMVILLSVLVLQGCGARIVDANHLESFALEDQVKSVQFEYIDVSKNQNKTIGLCMMAVDPRENVKMYFDEAGYINEIFARLSDDTTLTSLYQYDSKNNLISLEGTLNSINGQTFLIMSSYATDDQGNLIIKDHKTSGQFIRVFGDTPETHEVFLDKYKRIIEVRDDQDQLLSETHYHKNGLMDELTDHEFNQVIKAQYSDDIMTEQSITKDDETVVLTFEYNYDEYENWIEQKAFIANEHVYTVKRTIEYYEDESNINAY